MPHLYKINLFSRREGGFSSFVSFSFCFLLLFSSRKNYVVSHYYKLLGVKNKHTLFSVFHLSFVEIIAQAICTFEDFIYLPCNTKSSVHTCPYQTIMCQQFYFWRKKYMYINHTKIRTQDIS